MRRPELSIKQILAWADAYHERTGQWPEAKAGLVWEAVDEKWVNIDQSLRKGLRGLHRGQTLARLLAKHRGKRNRKRLPHFTQRQILGWADAHREKTGNWPRSGDGPIAIAPGETWWAVDMALRNGLRGLPGGSSLPQLLAAERGVINRSARPRLTVSQILRWADEHHARTGTWPTAHSGPICQSHGDTWYAIASALNCAGRGLRRSSLAQLLARHRRVTRHVRKPPLTIDKILAWADEQHERTGQWPTAMSGKVLDAKSESWRRINAALSQGKRGLPGSETLAVLLAKHRGRRTRVYLPRLTEAVIRRWVRLYKHRHGRWPGRKSGVITGVVTETWSGVDVALKKGRRGLRGNSSLSRLVHA